MASSSDTFRASFLMMLANYVSQSSWSSCDTLSTDNTPGVASAVRGLMGFSGREVFASFAWAW